MKRLKQIGLAAALLLAMCACAGRHSEPQMEGHYTYEHAFNYDLYGHHLDVHETGTMDFYADGSALDSARQVYVATSEGGDTSTFVFNYISPSRWRLEGDTLFFAGFKEDFRMEVLENDKELELPQQSIDLYSDGIDYEYNFHLDTLTSDRLQWSFTYRDGHSDTWVFFRN